MPKPFLLLSITFVFSLVAIFTLYTLFAQQSDAPQYREPNVPPLTAPVGKSDDQEVPLPTSSGNSPTVKDDCVVGGCSGQLCLEKSSGGLATTCEYREEYACYRSATCEKQTDGNCGWTMTSELRQCLVEAESRSNRVFMPQ